MSIFAIEEHDLGIYGDYKYKRLHAAGCGDLRDPEVLGEFTSKEELVYVLKGYGWTGECVGDLMVTAYVAPCARKLIETMGD